MMRAVQLAALCVALAAAACTNRPSTPGASPAALSMQLVGAGSTFDNPFFSRAFYEYSRLHTNVTVNYQSIGSGGGIQQFTKRTVDFGATDVPMGAKDLALVKGGAAEVVQIPVALGGVVVAYNVPNAPPHLRLSPALVAGIFRGTIVRWNDAAIAHANPTVTLPDMPIVVVHRADGSGTTYIFTSYLSVISPEWKQQPGIGKTVAWPAASSVGAKGNEGVAGQIRNTPGAIGYIELAYALQNDIAYAALQNRSGAYVLPSIESVRAAAAGKPRVTATDFAIVDESGAGAYPIAGYSWALLYRHYPDAARRNALYDLFAWLVADGQHYAQLLDYVPLPPAVSAVATSALKH